MKSIMTVLVVAFTTLVFLSSCGEKGLGLTITVDQYGNQYQNVPWNNGNYPYYGTNRPTGVVTFVGYVKGGSFGNQSEIPIYNNAGQPMYYYNSYGQLNIVTASGAWINGPNGTNFFNWLQNQQPGRLIFVVVSKTSSGITYQEYFRIELADI